MRISHDDLQKLLVCEHGSINESFIDVYQITGEEKYLKWAQRLNDEDMWVPMSEGKDILEGWHANTQIPKLQVSNLFIVMIVMNVLPQLPVSFGIQ